MNVCHGHFVPWQSWGPMDRPLYSLPVISNSTSEFQSAISSRIEDFDRCKAADGCLDAFALKTLLDIWPQSCAYRHMR